MNNNSVFSKSRKIYVASSWSNPFYSSINGILKLEGHEVYDWRNENSAFDWHDLDPDWNRWDVFNYLQAMGTAKAQNAFRNDMEALKWCDTCIILTPCGRSASLEFGFACGQGKETFVLYGDDKLKQPVQAELMLWMGRRHFNLRTQQKEFLECLRK